MWSTTPTRHKSRRRQNSNAAQDVALAAIVRSSQDAVISKTVEGVVTAWNDGAATIYGQTAKQMIGQNIEVTIPGGVLAQERARHARVADGIAESGYRCWRLRVDGEPIEVIMSMSPVRDARGRVIGVASISRPLNDGERDEARFAALLEAAPDAIVCVDQRGEIAAVNAQVTALFGYEPRQLLGLKMEVLLPDELRAGHPAHRWDFMQNPQRRSMGAGLSLSGRRRDGTIFPIEVSLSPDRTGPDSLAIAAVRDVSAQRASETAVRESESRLRQLAESVDIVFVLRQLNPASNLYVSPGSLAVLGRAPAEVLSNPEIIAQLVHPEDSDRVEIEYLDPSREGLAARSEYRILLPDGGMHWVRATCTPVPNPNGEPERAVIVVEDITHQVEGADALRQAETAARSANEAKNQFLSRMSHELRTPLNAVLGFGQLLQRQLTATDHVEAVGHILKGGRHLLDLINDVLDIARIESGDMSISSEPVPVSSVVNETVDLMAPLAEAAGVKLAVIAGNVGQCVLADRQRLRQILLNLLSNAIKYNLTGGHVWVGWETEADRVSLFVKDDGPGIKAELQPRLFTPFDRLGAEASGIDGAGIGLALTRALAEMMGGSITVESAGGAGSRFTVRLPSIEPPNTVSVSPIVDVSVVENARLAPARTLLYIEDNAPNVRVIEHLLRLRPQWHLVHAALGSLGIELAEAHLPDLILLDLHLPDMPGHEVLQALKNRPATADTPVVILTADASPGQSRRLVRAGATGYLTKPLDVNEVLEFLDQVSLETLGSR